jgi:hypothetical protein
VTNFEDSLVEVLTDFDRFRPLTVTHPGVGQLCAVCSEALQAGQVPSLVNPTPASPEDERKAAEARPHTVAAQLAHQSCAYPGIVAVDSADIESR